MTEKELRQYVVDVACSYLGCNEADGSHMRIVELYNAHKPLARGYAVQRNDAWCATFPSAVAIQCGLTGIMPTECGCEEMIKLYKALGRWVENDAYVPQPGDIIFYDWDDTGAGDNTGYSDHVGIVVSVDNGVVRTIEGNVSDSVDYRSVAVNGRYIRGYGVPDYKNYKGDEKMKFGIDISSHQPSVNYAEVAKGIDFAILKVSEGTHLADRCFDMHYNGLKAKGIPVGAYVYTYAASTEAGKAEADYALELLKGRALDLPVYLDIEADVIQNGSAACMAGALGFGERIKAAGYRWGVYASTSRFTSGFLNIPQLQAAGASIWVAQYGSASAPACDCDIWQYTSDYVFAGLKGVDANKMFKDIIVPEPERDLSDVADWARDAAKLLIDADIIHGDPDGKLRGYDNVTRNELFVALANMLNR